MNVDVYDTHAHTTDGQVLHFDVLLPTGSGAKALEYAREWLQSIGMVSTGSLWTNAASAIPRRPHQKCSDSWKAKGISSCKWKAALLPFFKLEKPGGDMKSLVTHYVRGSTHRQRRDHSRRRSAGLPRGLSNLDTHQVHDVAKGTSAGKSLYGYSPHIWK